MSMKKCVMAGVFVALALMHFTACKQPGSNGGKEPVPVTGVSLNKTTLSLAVGETETLTATITPDDATNQTVTWSSNKADVATVNSGTVTAIKAGTAIITVTTEDGEKKATCAVTIIAPIAVTGVTLNKNAITLSVGETEILTATVVPSNAANKKVTWGSSDDAIATVSNGTISAIAAGTATITVTTDDGGKTATCAVTITAPIAVTGVSLNKSALSLTVGETETLTATIAPSDATNKNVSWVSSDTTIATVTGGKVVAVKAGTAAITVTTEDGGKIATCAVTIADPIAVTGVTLNKIATILTVGETETLTATVAPSDAYNKAITWSSSNTAVATVSGGTITALKAGTATITVTTVDGSKAATCAVTVNKAEESFSITFAQIADAAPEITGPTIYHSSINGPTTATLAVDNPDQYSSIDWYININGIHRQGAAYTLNSADYTGAGEYVLTIEVIKDGIPYNRTVTFTVAN